MGVNLDNDAPSPNSEYRRFLDSDYLGKLLFKSFLVHRAGVSHDRIHIPLSRHRDIGQDNVVLHDATVDVEDVHLDIEIKCARINIANKDKGGTKDNWQFSFLLKTHNQAEKKKYDIAFAIGILTKGHEDPNYWKYESETAERLRKANIDFNIEAMPHDEEYLKRCGFFIFAFDDILTNYLRFTIDRIDKRKERVHFAWGYEIEHCKKLWEGCVKHVLKQRREQGFPMS